MITFRFTGTDGTMVETETLTSGMVRKKVKLEFSNDWDNKTKMVVFTAGSVSRDVVCTSDILEIPAEVLAQPLRQLYVGVYGVSDEGEVTPTIRVMGPEIIPGVEPSGEQSATPSLPVWAQLLTMIGDLENLDTEARENLVAAINEVLGKAGTGGSVDLKDYAKREELPTRVSQLDNDSSFITAAVADLLNYYSKSETYTREEIDQKVSAIPKFSVKVVAALPSEEISETTIYLLKSGNDSGDLYTEYIFTEGKWEILGSQRVDLTGYATEAWVSDLLGKLPEAPVQSINGKTGAVSLTAEDVGARSADWVPTAQEVGALPNTYTPPTQTAQQVGADPQGTAAAAVSRHDTSVDSHEDLRLELRAINNRLTAFFDSDDQTLDELSEIVAYITSNKSLIDAITTSKVSVADIVNNLTTNVANKPLSAAQGVILKELIDGLSVGKLDAAKLPEAVNDALAQAKASGEFDGAPGKDGKTPVKGTDYFTAADKTEIVNQVIASLPVYSGEVV